MANQKKDDYSANEIQLALYAKAMGHPARLAILNFLASLDTCFFGDICNELPIANSTVSQHLTELKNAGLIQGTIELPKVKYCIEKENWYKAKKAFGEFFAQIDKEKCNCK